MSFKASSFDLIKDLPSEKNVIEAALLAKMSISDTKISFDSKVIVNQVVKSIEAKWREANNGSRRKYMMFECNEFI